MEDRRSKENEAMRAVVARLVSEREFQNRRWGAENEARTDPNEWVTLLSMYLGKVARESPAYKQGAFNLKKFLQCVIELSAMGALTVEKLSSLLDEDQDPTIN
jgi:hypothetical protein